MINLRKIVILFIVCMLLASMVYGVYASGSIKSDFPGTVESDKTNAPKKILGGILGVVRTVGMAVAIVALVVIACKYMLSAPGDRADLKKYIPVYVIGALVLFGASAIVGMIRDTVLEATE